MQKKNLQLTLAAMFLALGLLWPMLFHSIGLGSMFLPMFWPVAAAAFFLNTPFALMLGLITPLLSGLLTGMPALAPPIAQVMMVELAALTAVVRLLYHKTQLGDFWILFFALLASRATFALAVAIVAPMLGWPAKIFSIAALLQSMPGVVAMLLFLPPLISRIKHEALFAARRSYVPPAS